MSARKLDCVIFDIGDVLIRWDPKHLYRKMFDSESAIDAFMAETDLMTVNLECDAGRPFDDMVSELSAAHVHYAEYIAAFHHRWPETLDGFIPPTVKLLADLKASGMPVYAISNFSREKFDIACGMFPFLTSFDDIVVSADVKLVKPDPAIYEILLRRRDIEPSRAIFIDDRADNIAAACALGLHGHHFAEARAEGLLEELKGFGIVA
jgi:2-haloacid dehalogenase